jgi:hypothetical protein
MNKVKDLYQQLLETMGLYEAHGVDAPAAHAFLTFISALEDECISLRATMEAQGKAIITLSDRLAELESSDVDVELKRA